MNETTRNWQYLLFACRVFSRGTYNFCCVLLLCVACRSKFSIGFFCFLLRFRYEQASYTVNIHILPASVVRAGINRGSPCLFFVVFSFFLIHDQLFTSRYFNYVSASFFFQTCGEEFGNRPVHRDLRTKH